MHTSHLYEQDTSNEEPLMGMPAYVTPSIAQQQALTT
jgi:hypothetical protein